MEHWIERVIGLGAVGIAVAACSSAAPPPDVPSEPEPDPVAVAPEPEPVVQAPEPEAEPEPEALVIPTACVDPAAEICMPPKAFVEQLCQQGSIGLAFHLFRKDTPWTRAYLRVTTDAWFADGRRSAPSKVERGEEVIIIANRTGAGNGPRVVGAGSYDVIRWDGSCVSVMEDEVSTKRPPMPKVAPLAWKRIEDPVRAKLLEDEKIDYRNDMRRKFCTSGKMESKACKNSMVALVRMVADYVRKGGALPEADFVVR